LRADRLLSLLLILQNGRKVKANELARKLEVSERTIYRDLDSLSGAGVPLYSEPGPNGGYALLEPFQTDLSGLSSAELQALVAFTGSDVLGDIGLGQALRTGLAKLAASLPAVQQLAAEHVKARLHFDTVPWFQQKEEAPQLPIVQEAVQQDRRLRFRYRRWEGEVQLREVSPYGLVVKAASWYLAAETERGLRVYRVSRMESAELLQEGFQRRPDFDLAAFWQQWRQEFERNLPHYPVKVRIAPQAVKDLLKTRPDWMSDGLATAVEEADGWRTMTLDYERPEYALGTLLEKGDQVEVLEPAALRQEVAEVVQRMAGFYRRLL
jgi:predicted DNA-binding transcriptional regulator YafY